MNGQLANWHKTQNSTANQHLHCDFVVINQPFSCSNQASSSHTDEKDLKCQALSTTPGQGRAGLDIVILGVHISIRLDCDSVQIVQQTYL